MLSRRLLLPSYWLPRSPYIVVISPFENSLFGWVKVRSLFVFGAPPPLHLPRASQASGRALAMFLLHEVGRLGPLTSLFISTSWYVVTDVLLLLFLVRRVSLPFSTYLRAREFSEICLLVFLFSAGGRPLAAPPIQLCQGLS